MTAWTSDELTKIGAGDELQLASLRRDGMQRNPVTVWVVRYGDSLYVRSVNGRGAAWFRGARARHEGHIQAGGVDKDVVFVDADQDIDDEVDAAYRAKYRRYPESIVSHIVSPKATSEAPSLGSRRRLGRRIRP